MEDFNTWIQRVKDVSGLGDDFDLPSPEFPAEYDEWVATWKLGKTPEAAWEDVLNTLPDE